MLKQKPIPYPPPHQPRPAPGKLYFIGRFLLIILVLFFNLIDASHAASNQAPQNKNSSKVIYFGLLPYLSTTALMRTWKPFAEYIEKTLQRKVIIKTAPDFRTFIRRTAEGRYDLLLTAPHFAALAVKASGYQLVAGHRNDLAGDIVVAKNARFQSVHELRGKIFITPDPLAAVSMLAELALKQHGLSPGRDISIKTTSSHNAALVAVAEGRATAAVAVGGLYRRLNNSNKFPQLRKLATTDKIPHAMYIAKASFPNDDIHKLRKALINPLPGTAGDKLVSALKKNFSGGSIGLVSPQKLARLAPLLSLLETKLSQE